MRPVIDIKDRLFGRLHVLSVSPVQRSNGEKMWLCRCTCPQKTLLTVGGNVLRTGKKQSCGCLWKPLNDKVIQRLIHKLDINAKTQDQCILWTGDKDKRGYGRMHIKEVGRKKKVIDIVWMIYMSKIPKGHKVVHLCGNKLCRRLDHLSLIKTE